MKSLKAIVTTFSALMVISATAMADGYADNPLKGFYVNANAGVNIMPDITTSAGGVTGKIGLNPGARVGASVGYMVPVMPKMSLGLEMEVGAIVNTLDNVSASAGGPATSVDARGYYYQLPFLVNAVAVFHTVPKWAFYAGVGGGGTYSRLHIRDIGGVRVDSDGDETDGAVQAMGGVRYQISPSSEVGLGYKYLAVFVKGTDRVESHAVVATYTFHF
jgi:opacity protein-like surface antigen